MSIQDIREKYERDLLDMENVIGVGIGKKEVNGIETDQDAVIVDVTEKKKERDLNEKDKVPKTLRLRGKNGEKAPTDVQEVGLVTAPPPGGSEGILGKIKKFFLRGKSRTDHWDPFPLGVSCAHKSITAGTSGWILVDTEKGRKYTVSSDLLTEEDKESPSSNNHVYAASDQARIGSETLQPGPHDDGKLPQDKNGELNGKVKLTDGVKVDLAWIDPTREAKNELLGIGVPKGPIHKVEVGDILVKSGRTTGVTQGRVKQAHASIRVRYPDPIGTITRKDVILTEKMLEGGDSGDSAIVNTGKRFAPAATGFAGSNRISVFDRIENVVELSGKKIKTGEENGGEEPEPPEKPEAEVTLVLERKEEEPDKGRIIARVEEKETGDPVYRAEVEIEGPTTGVGDTDPEGKVIFDPVLIGDYIITARKKGYKSDQVEISEEDFSGGEEGRVNPRKIIDVDLSEGWKWYEPPQGGETSVSRYASTEGGVGKPNLTVQCSSLETREEAIDLYERIKKTGVPPGWRKEKEQFIGERSVMWTNRMTGTATILMQYGTFVIVRIPFQVNHDSLDTAIKMAEDYAGRELSNMKKYTSEEYEREPEIEYPIEFVDTEWRSNR